MAGLLAPVAAAPLPIRLLGRVVDWVVIGIGATMAIMVFVNVCLHFFSKDMAWVTEFGELLMVWVTFLGGACAAQRGTHMVITEFIDKLEPAGRRWADAAVQATCLAMLFILVRFGWSLVHESWGNELTVLGWPMAIQYMGMALGSSLMTVFVAFDLLQILRGVPREQRYPASE
jgi:TRAP-type transport system small permease protein